jgi:ABC-2 type transport system permease protein
MFSTPMQTDDVVKGTISAVCYAAVLWSLAWWRFLRKDVVS